MKSSALSKSECFCCRHSEKMRYTKRIGVLGAGNVVKTKISPALEANSHLLEDVIICSAEPPSQVTWTPYRYLSVESGSLLPLDYLGEQGFLNDTLWIIATPSNYHVQYGLQLAPFCKIAIEKPIASTARQAKLLRPYASQLYAIDHKIFNASPLSFIRRLRRDSSKLDAIRRVHGIFYETDGIAKGREADDTIADIQYHLLAALQAILKTSDIPFEFTISQVFASKYCQEPEQRFQSPDACTSSRIIGLVQRGGRYIQFDFRQAKGAPVNAKFIRFFDESDHLIEEVDMNESGFQAHARIIGSLLQPVIDLRHSYEDAIVIMELLDTCRESASQQEDYKFGQLPKYLQ